MASIMAPVHSSLRRRALLSIIIACAAKKKSIVKKRLWVKKWLERRKEKGSFSEIFQELQHEEPNDYIDYVRLSPEIFIFILNKISPAIKKNYTLLRDAISPGARLEVTTIFSYWQFLLLSAI